LAAHEAIQEPAVRLLEVYDPPPKAREVELSTWQPNADQPVGRADAAIGVGVPVGAMYVAVGALGPLNMFNLYPPPQYDH